VAWHYQLLGLSASSTFASNRPGLAKSILFLSRDAGSHYWRFLLYVSLYRAARHSSREASIHPPGVDWCSGPNASTSYRRGTIRLSSSAPRRDDLEAMRHEHEYRRIPPRNAHIASYGISNGELSVWGAKVCSVWGTRWSRQQTDLRKPWPRRFCL
jgi:hypothetical protein